MKTAKFKVGDRVKVVVNTHSGLCDRRDCMRDCRDCDNGQECNCDDYAYYDEFVGMEGILIKFNLFNREGVACWYANLEDGTIEAVSVCESDLELI